MKNQSSKLVLKRIVCLILAVMLMVAFVPSTQASAATKKGWVTSKGYKYYYLKTGKKATGVTKIGKYTYYFSTEKKTVTVNGKKKTVAQKGSLLKGWYKIKSDYYYFDRSTGKMAKSKTVDGIEIKSNGKAKKTTYNKKKIALMIRSREMVEKITNVKDSKDAKRLKCFNYIKDTNNVPYIPYHFLKNVRSDKSWDIIMANDILDDTAHISAVTGKNQPGGECTAMASAFAYLALECGYKTVYIVDDDKTLKGDNHTWVEIGGKVFDPLFARNSVHGGMDNNYNAAYRYDGNLAHWAINKKNVSTGAVSTVTY